MVDGYNLAADMIYTDGSFFVQHLLKFLGETVTIFTTSGGDSGSGFTGVLTLVTPEYVRLVTAIGFPPECSLGNACTGFLGGSFGRSGFGRSLGSPRTALFGLGSVVDIPISKIASFAHHTL